MPVYATGASPSLRQLHNFSLALCSFYHGALFLLMQGNAFEFYIPYLLSFLLQTSVSTAAADNGITLAGCKQDLNKTPVLVTRGKKEQKACAKTPGLRVNGFRQKVFDADMRISNGKSFVCECVRVIVATETPFLGAYLN
jgi:hypothetical protein